MNNGTEMDKKSVETPLNTQLVSQGFKRKVSSWYRQMEGALQVVNLQKSSFGEQFYLNLGCVPAGMDVEGMPFPKEYKCPIRIRLTSAFPEEKKEIEDVLNLEQGNITESVRHEQITRLVQERVLPFLEYMRDAAILRQAIEEGLFTHGSINLAARKHLGFKSI